MKSLASLTRPDGAVATFDATMAWRCPDDGVWEEMLNVRFNPRVMRAEAEAGLPGYVALVAAAARHYGCAARYPWSDAKPFPGAVY